ncbi:maltose acetyltransferase domain-containing protein [Paenibacillus sp. EKM212P]|uniref:maltose acetyltransferase domain-containing protein n=1 Tax=Paenibacillus sp. EKM212P TaxID=1683680 RepID=UPI001EEBC311|nr:maltose acetyltransferase domain-containing protein [Paenibacillus sp. EKM212P]
MIEERLYAKSLCHEYNQLHPRNIKERETLIKTLLGKTTDRFLIEQPFVVTMAITLKSVKISIVTIIRSCLMGQKV